MLPELGGAVAQGSGYALASAAAVAMMLMVGFLVLARGPASAVNRSFMGIIIACCLWMGGRAGMFGSLTAREASNWHILSFTGLAYIPSAIYFFAASATASTGRNLKSIALAFTASTSLTLLNFIRPDTVIHIMPNARTGWFPRYYVGGHLLVAFVVVVCAASAVLLLRSRVPRSPTEARERTRIRLILVGLVAGSTGILDTLAAIGLDHPPIAHFSILVGVAFCGYAVGRYRVVILTPSTTVETIVNDMREALFFLDLDGRILFANRSLALLLGYPEEEVVGKSWKSILEADQGFDMDLGTKGRGVIGVQGAILRSRSGERIPVAVTVTPHYDEEGEAAGYVGLALDQREQARFVDRIADLEREAETLLNNSMFGVFVISGGRPVYVNQKAASLVGYTPEEVLALGLEGIIHPDDLDMVVERATLREKGENPENHYVLRAVHKNGETRQLEIFGMSIQRGDQYVDLGFVLDVTEERRTESELRRVNEFNEWILKNIPVGILMVDRQGWIVYVNPKACEILSAESVHALQGRHVRDTVLGGSPPLQALFGNHGGREAGPELGKVVLTRVNGRALGLSVNAAPSGLGSSEGYFLVIDDAARLSGGEAGLSLEDKAQWLGLLYGAIARDFEGLLGGILGYSSLARALLPGEEKVSGYIDAIAQSAQKALDLTGRLASQSKGPTGVERQLHANTLVENTLRRLERSLGSSIEVRTSLGEKLPRVVGDSEQLQEMLFQIGLNAKAAMPEGGRLSVSTEELNLTDGFATDREGVLPGRYVCISVSDSGVGIAQEVRERVFEPFFTTRTEEGALGMGLWLAHAIVRKHRGSLVLESAPGRGTTVQVYLPAVKDAEAVAPETSEAEPRKEGRVLVVDDEPSVREVASELLQELGYEVLTAPDGLDAMAVLRDKGSVDVVILDMVMPRMNGEETFTRLRELDPAISVIISSGYSEDEKVRGLLSRGAISFVQKPYRIQTLVNAVEEALEVRAQALR